MNETSGPIKYRDIVKAQDGGVCSLLHTHSVKYPQEKKIFSSLLNKSSTVCVIEFSHGQKYSVVQNATIEKTHTFQHFNLPALACGQGNEAEVNSK